jgi:dephospho-CoA kinase
MMSVRCLVAIVIAGMPGSGKTVFSDVAREMGFGVYVMGDVIREELVRRGLPITRDNMSLVAREMRVLHGEDIVARRIADKIFMDRCKLVSSDGCCHVVIDGARSISELDLFRRVFSRVILVAIHASPRARFARLVSRGRDGDPRSWEDFEMRDRFELSMGLGSLIALADIMIINEGIDLEDFRAKSREILVNIYRGGLPEYLA